MANICENKIVVDTVISPYDLWLFKEDVPLVDAIDFDYMEFDPDPSWTDDEEYWWTYSYWDWYVNIQEWFWKWWHYEFTFGSRWSAPMEFIERFFKSLHEKDKNVVPVHYYYESWMEFSWGSFIDNQWTFIESFDIWPETYYSNIFDKIVVDPEFIYESWIQFNDESYFISPEEIKKMLEKKLLDAPIDYSHEEIEEEIKNLIETFPCLET